MQKSYILNSLAICLKGKFNLGSASIWKDYQILSKFWKHIHFRGKLQLTTQGYILFYFIVQKSIKNTTNALYAQKAE